MSVWKAHDAQVQADTIGGAAESVRSIVQLIGDIDVSSTLSFRDGPNGSARSAAR